MARRRSIRSARTGSCEFQPDPKTEILRSAKEELDGLLRRSVREHWFPTFRSAYGSSGGLDSSTILHYAAQASPARLKTFSVSFQGRSFDETPYFREVAGATARTTTNSI